MTTPTVQTVRDAIAPVLARLGATAAGREVARDFAFDDVRRLAKAGVGLLLIAPHEGGAGASVRETTEVAIDIARADSSVAQALRPLFLTAFGVATQPDFPRREALLKALLAGDLFAGTTNERAGGPGGEITTKAVTVDDGWIVTGAKYYSTGGLYADWFGGTAQTEDGKVLSFRVPVDRAGVERLDDFDAIGQRLTASGTTRLNDVWVARDEGQILGARAVDNPWQTTVYAQLYLAAVEAGIAARALDDAVWYVREKARPIKHSSADRSVDDPYVRQTVGQIAAQAQSARAVVLLVAETIERTAALSGQEARAAGARTSVEVAQAGSVAIAAALKATELLFDVGGGSITNRDLGFDRHWRNARTAANHNPRQWKEGVAGAYHLVGEEPPTTGLF